MAGGRGEEPSTSLLRPPPQSNGGEFLLRLVQKPHQQPHNPSPPALPLRPQNLSLDPAVAAVGPAIPNPMDNNLDHQSLSPPPWSLTPPNSSPYRPNFFLHGFPPNAPHWSRHQSSPHPPPILGGPNQQFNLYQQQGRDKVLFGNMAFSMPNEGWVNGNFFDKPIGGQNSLPKAKLENFEEGELGLNVRSRIVNAFNDRDWGSEALGHSGVFGSPEMRQPCRPPGFSGKPMNRGKSFELNVGRGTSSCELNNRSLSSSYKNHVKEPRFPSSDSDTGCSSGSGEIGLSGQLDRPGPPAGSNLHSVSASDIEESLLNMHAEVADNGDRQGYGMRDRLRNYEYGHGRSEDEIGDVRDQLADSLEISDESNGKNSAKKQHRDKDFRSDARGQRLLTQRMRNMKRLIECRSDIHRLNASFLVIYESLIPAEEEKVKQKRLLTSLEKLVCREWPNARCFMMGTPFDELVHGFGKDRGKERGVSDFQASAPRDFGATSHTYPLRFLGLLCSKMEALQPHPEDLPSVLVLRPPPVYSHFQSDFSRDFHFIKAYESPLPTPQFLTTYASHITAMLVTGAGPPITKDDVLQYLPSLVCIVTTSAGLNHIDMAECRRRSIAVANTGDVYSNDVADATVALLIDVLRKISAGDRYVRGGLWTEDGLFALGSKLSGKRVGIVGLGNIGCKVAKRLEAFGCTILYNSRKMKPSVSYGYHSDVCDLAANVDILIICCALTDETKHMINKDVLSKLRKHGVIVNVARGAVIDEKELVRCLVEHEIAGAGLDVFENEPSVPKELFALDNVVLSPHRAVFTSESFHDVYEHVSGNLKAFFSGKPLLSPVVDE
ncbi:hypothetical protein Ancab_037117 [Ancistrocladus abbreviatus]